MARLVDQAQSQRWRRQLRAQQEIVGTANKDTATHHRRLAFLHHPQRLFVLPLGVTGARQVQQEEWPVKRDVDRRLVERGTKRRDLVAFTIEHTPAGVKAGRDRLEYTQSQLVG